MFSAVGDFRWETQPINGSFFATYGNGITANANTGGQINTVVSTNSNVYICGEYYPNEENINIIKQNSNSFIAYQKELYNATYGDFVFSAVLDSSENLYITGGQGDNSVIAKYNSSGALQWQNKFNNFTGNNSNLTAAYTVNILANNNVILSAGYTTFVISGNTNSYPSLVKYYSNGGFQGGYVGSNVEGIINSIATDNSNNYVLCGRTIEDNVYYSTVEKFYGNGTLEWTTSLSLSDTGGIRKAVIDTGGNIHAITTNNYIILNSSGSVVSVLAPNMNSNTFINFNDINLIGSGNVYIAGYIEQSNNKATGSYMEFYPGNTTPIFQNEISFSSNISLTTLSQSNSYLYLGGYIYDPNSTQGLLARVPNNGSETGAHGPYTITSNTITFSTPTYSVGSFTFGLSSNSSISNATGNLTSESGSITRRILPF